MGKFKILFLIGLIFLVVPSFVSADELLEKREFFVDPFYDLNNREEITATLQRITDQLYFYLDEEWWDSLTIEEQKEINGALSDLSQEFTNKIYPILTLNYGTEWKLGIDGDRRITILVHPMIETSAGYFNPGDEYPKAQVPTSNQREMVYLNASQITSVINRSFLAHEFTHLITFNQKDRLRGVIEEVWLNEARAEYAPTLLGYDEEYQDSNLQRRVRQFLDKPQDSLTEWQGKAADYGILNLFTQYLVDHYGKEILIDSLRSEKVGIPSLNYALVKNGFSEDFSQIFTNWTIAIFVNDCNVGPKYCYLNDNLKNLRITPFIYYLPTAGESTLSVGYLTKEWTGNWQKIIGGKESLRLEFTGNLEADFKVSYIIEDSSGKSVDFIQLDQSQKGTVYVSDEKITSLTIIPSIQDKTSDFSGEEPSYQFFWSATSEKSAEEKEAELIEELKEQIEALKAQIAILQAQIAAILGQEAFCGIGEEDKSSSSPFASAWVFNNDLYYGMKDNLEVRCLQEFLKSQGSEIYPEGFITGNFLSLTQQAVIRFQEKYREEILEPINLAQGTGYFGSLTREKANKLIHK